MTGGTELAPRAPQLMRTRNRRGFRILQVKVEPLPGARNVHQA
ncbi:hypothetical protein [Streptomyces sp. NPDC001068]